MGITRGGPTGAVQLKQLASDYSQQKHTTWAGRGQIIIVQSKANYLSCTVPVQPPLGYNYMVHMHMHACAHNLYVRTILPCHQPYNLVCVHAWILLN